MNSIRPSTPVLPAASDAMPTREDAEAAVRTLLRWAGDDPDREGLADTSDHLIRQYDATTYLTVAEHDRGRR